jgi:hypothetical protein
MNNVAETEVSVNNLQVFVMTCNFVSSTSGYHTRSHAHPSMVKTGVPALCAKRRILSRLALKFSKLRCRFIGLLDYEARHRFSLTKRLRLSVTTKVLAPSSMISTSPRAISK